MQCNMDDNGVLSQFIEVGDRGEQDRGGGCDRDRSARSKGLESREEWIRIVSDGYYLEDMSVCCAQ